MASDADSAKPANEAAPGPAETPAEADAAPEPADADGEQTGHEATAPTDTAGEAAADGPAEVAKRGGPGLFLALTCGFLACLCCIGAVFAGGSVAWVRMDNLDEAIERLGNPDGWHTDSSSTLPWGAEAELSGPAKAEPVREWLELIGTPPAEKRVASCLESDKKCTVDGDYLGFPVSVEYGSGGEESVATVHVG